MKFLLVAVNAKYIHSNLGVYSLKAYANRYASMGSSQIEIGEYTINHQMEDVLKDIYKKKPDVVGFSCYIWNITFVRGLIRDLKKILPDVKIWLGGPEVSFDADTVLKELLEADGIMMGEGEETFAEVISYYADKGVLSGGERLRGIKGIAFRDDQDGAVINPPRPALDLSRIPFPYQELTDFDHRIIYYESSRGCPFSCSYCLSSLDKSVRFRDMELVKEELQFFLDRKVPQVKFVDRTFNCRKRHTLEIWEYLVRHDNGVTNFHFEISADLLDEEEISLIGQMRPGLIQLEIGVQSTNLDTIKEIRRRTDLTRLAEVAGKIHAFHNTHQHLDLIAGLPYEGFDSFKKSFNDVYGMAPDQLQLGFLKVLKGSYMEKMTDNYDLRFSAQPPYEVLSTKWLSYQDIIRLKGVEEMVERYENSGQFTTVMKELMKDFASPFDVFSALADYYEGKGLFGMNHNRMARYEILADFVEESMPEKSGWYQDLLVCDLYLRENLKSRPEFAADQEPYRDWIWQYFKQEALKRRYLKKGYEGYSDRQLMRMAHIEVFRNGTAVLFDYQNRDPLNYNAAACIVGENL